MTIQIKRNQTGFSIIELMIALTLGLLIMLGLSTIYIKNLNTRNEIERANQQVENGRYAMQILTDDLQNAGYLGSLDPRPLVTPLVKPDPCANDLATLKLALPLAIQGYDNGTVVPSCLADVKTGTDIVVIRRANTCALGELGCDAQVNGDPYFQASECSNANELSSSNSADYYVLDTAISNFTKHKNDCTPSSGTIAPIYQYRTHIYFIANNDKSGDGIPTLKRAELGVGGFTTVPLVEGIEDLQLEYGIDTSIIGVPAIFIANPDGYLGCSGQTCLDYWRNSVAEKIYILARNTSITNGYTSAKIYSMGLKADGTANVDGPFNDSYKRHAYNSVVRTINISSRNNTQ